MNARTTIVTFYSVKNRIDPSRVNNIKKMSESHKPSGREKKNCPQRMNRTVRKICHSAWPTPRQATNKINTKIDYHALLIPRQATG